MTDLVLGTTYPVDCDNGNVVKFLDKIKLICYESDDDGGLSHKPYNIAVAVKSLHNYTNPKPDDPHGLKEELKVKYDATLAIAKKFPNRTALIEQLLKDDGGQTWND